MNEKMPEIQHARTNMRCSFERSTGGLAAACSSTVGGTTSSGSARRATPVGSSFFSTSLSLSVDALTTVPSDGSFESERAMALVPFQS